MVSFFGIHKIRRAGETEALIEKSMVADQGAGYRSFLKEAINEVSDAFNPKTEYFRSHLGASLIGKKCSRELWYSFRWVKKNIFEGRILRLFNRGHLEEARFVAIIRSIGCKLWQFDEYGKQFRIHSVFNHFGGSLDAVVQGLPEIPDQPCLAEFKTHSLKSFDKIVSLGVKSAKPEHYIQMQMYMKAYNLKYGYYFAVCKNDDQLYVEIIELIEEVSEEHTRKADYIILTPEAPKRISENPAIFDCKYCSYNDVCHYGEQAERNCRTCLHAKPSLTGDATFLCTKYNKNLTPTEQIDVAPTCEEYSVNKSIYQ